MLEFLSGHDQWAWMVLLAALVVALSLLTLWGLRLGRRLRPKIVDPAPALGAVEACVFGLFGLLIAFTFSGAAERFRGRRDQILVEAQAAGTAWSRLALLDEPARSALRARLRTYMEGRLDAHASETIDEREGKLRRVEALGDEILAEATEACRAQGSAPATTLVIPGLEELTDIGLARKAATRDHPPAILFALLVSYALCVAVMVGMSMAPTLSWVHVVGFALVVGATLYVTIDMELPRFGHVRLDSADRLIQEVVETWK
jgi:hypothetical protein